MKNSYTYRIIIEPDGKYFHAYVPALPGCHTFGKSFLEAKKNVREAIQIYLKSLSEHNETIPEDAGLEAFETVTFKAGRIYA